MGVYHDEVMFPLKGGKSTRVLCYGLVGHTQGDSGARGGLLRFWHSGGSYELCLLYLCLGWTTKNGCERLPSFLPYLGECHEAHQEVGCEGNTGSSLLDPT